jgi:ribosomal protein S9
MLPSGVQFNSQQATHGGYNSTTGIWNLAAPLFLAGESATLELTVTVDGGAVSEPLSQPVYD